MLRRRQAIAIALLACLVVAIAWLDRVSWERSHQNAHLQTEPDRTDGEAPHIIRSESADDRIARYTLWLAILTGVLSLSTISLWWVTRRTANIAERALYTTERAFVFLNEFHPDWQTVTQDNVPRLVRFVIKPQWMNSGNTPTRNGLIQVNWTIWEGDLPQGFGYEYAEPATPLFLGPRATEWSAPIDIPNDVSIRASNGQTHIFVWGRIDYRDIFENSRPHFSQWCYRVRFYRVGAEVRSQFVAFGPYNRTDEDTRP